MAPPLTTSPAPQVPETTRVPSTTPSQPTLFTSPASTPSSTPNSNSIAPPPPLALVIDTQKPRRPQNASSLSLKPADSTLSLYSPNQLQGVVVESLKTPVRGPAEGPSRPADAFGGKLFEPENNLDQNGSTTSTGGIAWMLYRQRSRSTGAIPALKDQPSTCTPPHASPKQWTTKKRLSHQDNSQSELAVSTLSLNTAKKATLEMDHGTQSMFFFNQRNRHLASPSTANTTASATTVTTTTTGRSSTPSPSSTSSGASTLCHSRTSSDQLHGVRRLLRWGRPLQTTNLSTASAMTTTTTMSHTSAFDPSVAPTHLHGKQLLYPPRKKQGQHVHFNDPSGPRRPTLQELSGKKPRMYGKGKSGLKGVDEKCFFSNERTYMHWIKFGLLLGSMALTLLSFDKSVGCQVGLFLVLVAMFTLVYATTTFHLRHGWMKALRTDVLYYDRYGPTVLFAALFLAYATNVALTMHKLFGDMADDEGNNFYFNNGGDPLDI